MDHAEALEQIEVAAAEPDGIDRLMAGDTAIAAAVAGHLAGCAACADELTRIRRVAEVAREAIRSQPDPALRDRTLQFVRAVGRDRAPVDHEAVEHEAAEHVARPVPMPVGAGNVVPERPGRSGRRWAWLAAAAAVAIVIVGAGYLAGAAGTNRAVADRDAQIALLVDAATTTLRIQSQPDAVRVALAPTPTAADATGAMLMSPGTGELVALATGLPPLADGQEYGCWVESGGGRTRLGRMYWAGDVWTWAGPVSGLERVPQGSRFGVSIGPAGGGGDTTPVLLGSL